MVQESVPRGDLRNSVVQGRTTENSRQPQTGESLSPAGPGQAWSAALLELGGCVSQPRLNFQQQEGETGKAEGQGGVAEVRHH